jgi:hypothetical protein
MLDNSVIYVNRYTYSTGNPFLQPNVVQSVLLKAVYRWLLLNAAFEHNKNDIIIQMENYSEDNPSITVESKYNYPSFNDLKVSLSASPTIGCWSPVWEVRLYKQWFKMDVPGGKNGEQVHLDRLSPTLRWNNAFRLPQGFVLNAGATWHGKSDNENNSADSYWWATASLYKDFLNHKLTFLLQSEDLFNTYRRKFKSYSGKFRQIEMNQRSGTTRIALTVQYRFNQKKNKYKGTGAGDGQRGRL